MVNTKINQKLVFTLLSLMLFSALTINFVKADKLVLDGITYDPAIITAGDEVDIIIQFHNEVVFGDDDKTENPAYILEVTLEPDDDLTKEYVIIADSKGDNVIGHVYGGQYYNKRFRVKFLNNAPAGNYEFKLKGVYYFEDKPVDPIQYIKFKVPVKKEGIILSVSNIVTLPSEVRPGDDYVKLTTYLENVGEKDAKNVEIVLEGDDDIESSYSDNNRKWVGRVNAGEQKQVTFFVDIDDYARVGVHNITFKMDYMDLDNNKYYKEIILPFLVKERPYLVVTKYSGSGLAGSSGKLKVWVKNIGTESAESVDVRLLKQDSQPFSYDVRSNYIGELEPGEEGLAVFDIKINRDAEIKEHDFKLLIRAKGDSDEGDDNIYTFNRRAKFKVTGIAPNKTKEYGIMAAIALGILIVLNTAYKITKALISRKKDKSNSKTRKRT